MPVFGRLEGVENALESCERTVILAAVFCVMICSTSRAWLDPLEPDVVTAMDAADTDFN